MKKVFVYVGHSNWGKSYALKELTDKSSRKKTTKIDDSKIFVRKMSNDDDVNNQKLLGFVEGIKELNYQNIIIAFCPNQNDIDTDKGKYAAKILENLKIVGELFFFVQKKQFKGDRVICNKQIEGLEKFGKVYILENIDEAAIRAEKFKEFVLLNL